jgi:hypothetical protein
MDYQEIIDRKLAIVNSPITNKILNPAGIPIK